MVRVKEENGFRVVVDAAPQVLSLECPDDVTHDSAAMSLAPSVAALHPRGFVSASVLAAKAKAFDDGLIAAIEIAAQAGAGTFAGKRKILELLAERLQPGFASDHIGAARHLGSGFTASQEAMAMVARFLGDEKLSKPIGFYTWSKDLENIFRQDRFLQSELPDAAAIDALARALRVDPVLRAGYEAWMSLAERLTNPFTRPDLRSAFHQLDRGTSPPFVRGTAVSPPSESPEGALVKRLFANTPIPDGFNLADRLIAEIRKGTVKLDPTPESGWYDRIAWSLETLAAPDRGPEARKLDLGKRYRETLEALFKGILALARESHVKQLEMPRAGCGPPQVQLRPDLTVEPLPTHYLRRGLGYRFVREVLDSTFGSAALRNLRRLTATGPVVASLGEELAAMETLFLGAHATSCDEIGIAANAQASSGNSGHFAKWVAALATDPDLAADNRMMVPVFYDVQRKQVKVWAFLGWTTRPLDVSFKTPPKVEVTGAGEKKGWFSKAAEAPKIIFEGATYALAYPVTAEVYVSRLLTRDEFRALCDRHRDQKELLANLK